MGFAPAEDPEVLVYVIIDTPDCEEYDTSWSAQMVAADIMHKLVPYLGIPADNPDYERDVYIDAKTLKPVVKRPSSVDVDEVKPDGGANLPDEEESASKRTDMKKNHQKMRNLMRMNPRLRKAHRMVWMNRRLRKVLPARHIMVHKVKTPIIK